MPEVPKIIHQIWLARKVEDNTTAPEKYYRNGFIQSWQVYNPDYQYKLWNMKEAKNLFNLYPVLLKYKSFWENLGVHIEKCDFVRYMIMATEGGFYTDLDFRNVASLEETLRWKVSGIMLFFEAKAHSSIADPISPRLSNSIIVSEAGHPFWFEWMDHIMKNYKVSGRVLMNTGPAALAQFVHNREFLKTNPEWFGNKCWFMAFTSAKTICDECLEYCSTDIVNGKFIKKRLSTSDKNPYLFTSAKANQLPYKKLIGFTEWGNGTSWGKKALRLLENGKNGKVDWYKVIEEEKKSRIYSDFSIGAPPNTTESIAFLTPVIFTSVAIFLILFIAFLIIGLQFARKNKSKKRIIYKKQ